MKKFFALSRASHSTIDIAMPAVCALIWLGYFPVISTIGISLITAFSGYTAIYALNDLIGVKSDKEKMNIGGEVQAYSVEASEFRHPIAAGVLSPQAGLTWILSWLAIAFMGAYYLNPAIVLVLFAGGLLEIVYCHLLKITHLRFIISGLVKFCGPLAAILVVDSNPDILKLSLLFSWIFFWEMAGQNVPADLNDVDEDKRIHAKTIPVVFGEKIAIKAIFLGLILTVLSSLLFIYYSNLKLKHVYLFGFSFISFYSLILPGYKLYQSNNPKLAARVFDKASFYPFWLLIFTSAMTLMMSV